MNLDQFNFELPEHLIAQSPLEKRDHSKLMVIDRKTEEIKSILFYQIIDEIDQHSVLVVNETKVIPARIFGVKEKTNAHIEILLLKELDKDIWETLIKPAKRIKVGDIINCHGLLELKCVASFDDGIKHFNLKYDGILIEVLEQIGTMPLPPYIHEKLDDQSRYQTVYAHNLGSAAAPTAGLHFTPSLLDQIQKKHIEIIKITLHVGLGTFRPVKVSDVKNHVMHEETYYLSEIAAQKLNDAKTSGKKIVAVGTTSLRALESNYNNGFTSGKFQTSIFIYPGYQFRAIDQLVTNFHLPKSTLFMLVSAFSSIKLMQLSYKMAIEEQFRFFSFGDAMFIK